MAIIKPKRGSGAPTVGQLLENELAVDTTNKRMYIGVSDGSGALIGSSPGGSDAQVQFNDGGVLGGDSGLTYNKTTDTLTVAGDVVINAQGDLRLSDSDSSNYIAFQAPTSVANNNVYTLPSAVGSANQVLQIASVSVDDATLQWGTITTNPGGVDTQVQFNDGGSTFGGDAGLTYNKTTDTLTVAGDIAVNGGDITSTSSTCALFNSGVSTINLGGAASAITIGDSTTATTTLRGGTLVGNTTTQNVFDTTATTVNSFGGATTLNIGYDGISSNSTTNIAVGAITSGITRTINIGTGGLTGVTNISLGYNGGGTTFLNSATVVGGGTTQALFNTVATTMNFSGAATNLTMGATSGSTSIRNPTIILSNSNNTGTIKTPGTGSLVLTTGALSSNGTNTDVTITGDADGAGFVQINGGDLYLGQKVDADPTVFPVNIVFEGSTANGFETTLTLVDPTADRTITLPNATGTVVTTGNLTDITSTGTITSGTWSGNTIAVGNGGTGTTTGSITGTGALTFTAGGTNTNINLVPNGTGSVDVNSKRIINLSTPDLSTDAATKGYVDSVAQGLHTHATAKAATTAKLATLTGATVSYSGGAITWTGGTALTSTFTDGISFTTNTTESLADRILVKNEGDSGGLGLAYNGTYYAYGARELRRTSDGDTAADWAGGDFCFILSGTLYASTGWVQTNDVTTLDTDSITWTQFSGSGAYTADEVTLTTSGTQFSIKSTYSGQTSIVTLGTVATGTWSASTIAVDKGGTGLTSYTAGDLLYASGSSAISTVAIGTSGHVLTSSGSAPQWTNVTGTGDVVKATSPTLVTPNIGAATGTSLSITGDLAVNGGNITTTATGTVSLYDINATTINVGTAAATTVNLGTNANGSVVNLCNGHISFSRTGSGMLYYSNLTDGSANGMNIKCNASGSPIKIGDVGATLNSTILTVNDSAGTITFDTGTGSYTFPTTNGSNGQVLTTNGSGTLTWSTVSGGSGITRSVNNISTTTSAGSTASTDYVYNVTSGTFTLTMPTAASNTNRYTIKQSGTGVLTIDTTSSQTIDGSTTYTMSKQYQAIDLISDGTNWIIV